MLQAFLEKIGLRHKPWYKRISGHRVLIIVIIVLLVSSVVALIQATKNGLLGSAVKLGSNRSEQQEQSAQAKQYREQMTTVIISYITARSVYQSQGNDPEILEKWLVVARQTEQALFEQVVPKPYQDFHLGAVIALSLEESGLDDLLGEASDTGSVGAGGLKTRGEEKLRTAQKRWEQLLQGQKEWLKI